MTWQPIESAPKDGRRVLLWAEEWTGPCTGQFYGPLGWMVDVVAGAFVYQPTHWRENVIAPVQKEIEASDKDVRLIGLPYSPDDERFARLLDSQYRAGHKAGWNECFARYVCPAP